jgi:hypothetical protein
MGTVSASELMRSLLNTERPSTLARAIADLGRIPKTLHLLRLIDDEGYRRSILTQLNRVFGNYRGTPQHLVFSLMCEGFITFQVQPDPPKQVAQVFNPISAALEHLDFVVQSFDPAAR